MDDNQDYEKIQVKAPANVLKNLNVVSGVKVEGEGGSTGTVSTNEFGFIIDTDTYGFGFPGCVTGITIPDSVTSIGAYAFNSCSGLATINYTGTEEQWIAINKANSWNRLCPSDMVINYNYQG